MREKCLSVPFYCTAPYGAFKIDELLGNRKWLSLPPSSDWLSGFGRRAMHHIPLAESEEELFIEMQDNVDNGFFGRVEVIM